MIIKAGAETCLKSDVILIDNIDIFVIIKKAGIKFLNGNQRFFRRRNYNGN